MGLFRSEAGRGLGFAARAEGRSLFGRRVRQTVAVTALGSILGGKLWLIHKYRQWSTGHNVAEQPGFRNRRSFAFLPRRKQRAVVYAKRAQLRDFESIAYGPGYMPGHRRRSLRRLF